MGYIPLSSLYTETFLTFSRGILILYVNTGLYKTLVFKHMKPAESFLLILFTWLKLFSLTWIVTFFSLHFICFFLYAVRSWLVEQILLSVSQERQHASTACSTTFADGPLKKIHFSCFIKWVIQMLGDTI